MNREQGKICDGFCLALQFVPVPIVKNTILLYNNPPPSIWMTATAVYWYVARLFFNWRVLPREMAAVLGKIQLGKNRVWKGVIAGKTFKVQKMVQTLQKMLWAHSFQKLSTKVS